MANSILFVDDEKPILRALYRTFQNEDCDLYFAESGEEALQILTDHSIEIVVSDMRMPSMDGHQLLQKIKTLYPETIRLILSGFAEREKVFRLLLDGSAQMYLVKPWNNQELVALLENILQLQSILKEKCLLDTVGTGESLPTLPSIYTHLCSLIEKDADMKDIVAMVESDPVIAGKVLKMANSAYMGVKVGSVQQAVAYLGLGVLKDLVLTTSVFTLSNAAGREIRTELSLLHKHAQSVNQIVSMLYQAVHNKRLPEEQASVGLLHDLGMIAMVKQFSTRYVDEIRSEQANCSLTFQDKEKEIFQISHAELGGYLLRWWQLPYPLVETALFHHEPLNPYVVNKNLLCLVHIADQYSWKNLLPETPPCDIQEEIWEAAEISPQECERLIVSSCIFK